MQIRLQQWSKHIDWLKHGRVPSWSWSASPCGLSPVIWILYVIRSLGWGYGNRLASSKICKFQWSLAACRVACIALMGCPATEYWTWRTGVNCCLAAYGSQSVCPGGRTGGCQIIHRMRLKFMAFIVADRRRASWLKRGWQWTRQLLPGDAEGGWSQVAGSAGHVTADFMWLFASTLRGQ